MSCSVEYDLATGEIYGCISPALPDSVTLPDGRAKLVFDDFVNIHGMMVDVGQKPPALIQAPPPPAATPDMTMLMFHSLITGQPIDPRLLHPDELDRINASLQSVGLSAVGN